jgi:hypothetical protein
MRIKFARLSLGCAVICIFATLGAAQANSHRKETSERSTTSRIVGGVGKAGVIVVGSAAKVGWEMTKFTTSQVARPAGKALLVNAAPKAAVLMLKTTGIGVKYLLPVVLKLSVL